MTAVTDPTHRFDSPDVPAPPREAAWERAAFLSVGLLATIVYLWNLTVSGYANTYYSAAAQAAALDWKAWFFGSLDPANFITLDKPPLATMVMGLSVRVFGLTSWSILLPEALMGIATVLVTFHLVRRSFGPVAAVIAGVVMVLTPVAVLVFRYNNPDALLTLLFVLAAWTAVRAIESGGIRWVLTTAVLVGFAFNTKYLQAYVVVPAFALTWLLFAAGSVRRRVGGLLVAGAALLAASGWWVAIVELIPAADRPYIGGSQTNSALELLLGYDGLQRVFGFFGGRGGGGAPPGGVVGGPGGGGFSGEPGLLRLFNEQLGGQIAWLLPLAAVGLVVGLWIRRRAARTDGPRAAYVLWGLWLATHVVVFSFMSGIIHSYYTVVMAPAVAALAGAGIVDLWALRSRTWWAGATLGAALVTTAVIGAMLLARTPDFAPWVGPLAVLVTLAIAAGLAVPAVLRDQPRLAAVGVAAAIVAVLLGPAAYAVDTMNTAYGGGDPAAGPGSGGGFGPGGGRGGFGPVNGGPVGDGAQPAPGGSLPGGGVAPTGDSGPQVPPGGTQTGPGGTGTAGSAMIDYLVANRGSATWLVAVSSANEAGPIQLAAGMPVLTMGGFSGSDPAMTVEKLRALVSSGQLRFVVATGGFGGAFRGPGAFGGSSVTEWVTTTCTPVTAVSGGLYDCGAAAGS